MRPAEPSTEDLPAGVASPPHPARSFGAAWRPRLAAFVNAHARLLLCVLALLPYLPGARQILMDGVPDVLLTGDAATLELRILHAAHGAQQLGPYSRFLWSHPGPAMFYLALPFYQLLHRHGPALNVFAFAAAASSAVALVLNGRQLRGGFFAALLALLLGLYAVVAVPFAMSSGWNPNLPILPLALLGVLAARLAVGGPPSVLVAFVFLASAIVQTHVGYLPVVLAETAVALVASLARWFWPSDAPSVAGAWRLAVRRGLAALAALAACWALPIVEQMTTRPGNLAELFWFFTRPHHADHTWTAALVEVFGQMALMPVALARAFHLTAGDPGWPVVRALGWGQLALCAGALVVGLLRRDRILAVLAALSLATFLVALSAVHEIRGEIYPYLVYWISTVGFLIAAVGAAWVDRLGSLGRAVRASSVALAGALLVALLVAVGADFGRAQLFSARDVAVEQLADAVVRGLAARPAVRRPVVHVASQSAWPAAIAIVLDLSKRGIPVAVEPDWLYMVGRSLAPRGGERFWLSLGDAGFHATSRARPDHALLASSGGVYAYLRDLHYLEAHQVIPGPGSVSAFAVRGSRAVVTDGVLPVEGGTWDSCASLVLLSTASAIEVAVPPGDLDGVYLSVDGNDLYAVRCVGAEGLAWLVGPSRPEEAEAGMRTRIIFSDDLRTCRAIEVRPASGDGAYSVGEIGFLRR